MRRAAKVDRNQSEIVDALRKAGATVYPMHSVGQGFPDLCVGYRGLNLLMEVKDGNLSPSGQRLTERQRQFRESWFGHYVVVTSVGEALEALGVKSV